MNETTTSETPVTNVMIGARVERVSNDYTNGRRGTVLEIAGNRARVAWDSAPRTWVRFSALKLVVPANTVTRGPWIQTPHSNHHSAVRSCRCGEMTWHEYAKR